MQEKGFLGIGFQEQRRIGNTELKMGHGCMFPHNPQSFALLVVTESEKSSFYVTENMGNDKVHEDPKQESQNIRATKKGQKWLGGSNEFLLSFSVLKVES